MKRISEQAKTLIDTSDISLVAVAQAERYTRERRFRVYLEAPAPRPRREREREKRFRVYREAPGFRPGPCPPAPKLIVMLLERYATRNEATKGDRFTTGECSTGPAPEVALKLDGPGANGRRLRLRPGIIHVIVAVFHPTSTSLFALNLVGHSTLAVNMGTQQGHSTRARIMCSRYGHSTWALNMDTQYGHSIWALLT